MINYTRKQFLLFSAVLILSFLTAHFLSQAYCVRENTLYNNGKWVNLKSYVFRDLMGDENFMRSTQALKGKRLNLSKWFGYHELIFYKEVVPEIVEFDFFLRYPMYFYFIFSKDDSGFSGIRFSNYRYFESMYFEADYLGRFIDSENIRGFNHAFKKQNHVRILFAGDEISLCLNGGFIRKFKNREIKKGFIGFKGAFRNVAIDNILIKDAKGEILLREDFENEKLYFLELFALFIMLMAVNFSLLHSKKSRGFTFSVVILFNSVLFLVSCMIFYVSNYYSGRYIKNDKILKKEEETWKKDFIKQKVRDVREKLSLSDDEDCNILVIGTSQTWGAGAKMKDLSLVRNMEKRLNELNPSEAYRCINAAIPSADTKELFYSYGGETIFSDIDIMVLNLSNNDRDKDVFAKYLKKFIIINNNRGIRTVFVLEANSFEQSNPLLPMHVTMMNVAREYDIPVIDLHRYLSANYDKGFLWWDCVHLTSLGQVMAGNFLADELFKIISY